MGVFWGVFGFWGWGVGVQAKHKPMDCEELMVKQTKMTVAASPDTKVRRPVLPPCAGIATALPFCVAVFQGIAN